MISNFKIFICVLPAIFLFNPLLFADTGVIEEVVITAQKKEESL